MSEMKKKRMTFSKLVALVGGILMILTLFLPYGTATAEHKKLLKEYPDEIVYEALGKTAEDTINMSMVEYVSVYTKVSDAVGGSDVVTVYVVIVATLGIFAVLTTLFALAKKSVAVIIFAILYLLVGVVQNLDYKSRGAIPSDTYNWGIAYYLVFVGAVLAIGGAIAMIVCKREKIVVQEG